MAYGQQNQRPPFQKAASTNTAAAVQPRQFKDDPNEIGIGYEKEMKNGGGNYITFKLTKDVAAGTKIVVFPNNKVKNRTDKTPTHKLKLSVTKAS